MGLSHRRLLWNGRHGTDCGTGFLIRILRDSGRGCRPLRFALSMTTFSFVCAARTAGTRGDVYDTLDAPPVTFGTRDRVKLPCRDGYKRPA
jgi:hypothetical protein